MLFMANVEGKPADRTGVGAYTTAERLLHWIIFGLITAQYAVGSIMPHSGRNTPNEGWVNSHLSLGAAILFFIFVCLMTRIADRVALFDSGAKWGRQLASATHITPYVLIFAMCLLGWAAASSRGWAVDRFGFVPLPASAATHSVWVHSAGDVHDVLLYLLLVPIGLHIFAALYHQYVVRDGLLERMSLGDRR
jgi:cytochrome b561